MIHLVHLSGKWDNLLRPGHETVIDWDTFAAALRHDVRGEAGTKAEEAKHKDADAFLPMRVDWSVPACSCAGFLRRAREGDRHRARCGAIADTSLVVIDVDGQGMADAFRQLAGTAFVAWTTYSHAREDTVLGERWRLAALLAEPVEAPDVPALRAGFARVLGLRDDPACRHPETLFYAPACPPEREHAARIVRGEGNALPVVRLLEIGRGIVGKRRGSRKAEPPAELTKAHRVFAQVHMRQAAWDLARVPFPGPIRDKVTAIAGRIGGYCGAGALSGVLALEWLCAGVEARLPAGEIDGDLGDKARDYVSQILTWGATRPVLPEDPARSFRVGVEGEAPISAEEARKLDVVGARAMHDVIPATAYELGRLHGFQPVREWLARTHPNMVEVYDLGASVPGETRFRRW